MDETTPATPTPTRPTPETNGPAVPESEFYRKLYAEWEDLAARHPAPTLDDVRPEWVWITNHLMADPENPHWDVHVAVYNQQVIGTDTDPIRAQVTAARQLGVHPERVVVVYMGGI